MTSGDDAIDNLREALGQSPENVPLRRHLAEMLLERGYPEEAEREFREALSRTPEEPRLKVGLARAFHHQGRGSEALVVIESLTAAGNAPAEAHALHARLLFESGEVEGAVAACRRALRADPDADVADLAEKLGVSPDDFEAQGEAEGEVVDGRMRARSGEGGSAGDLTGLERPTANFEDVGGMAELKEEIRLKIITPLEKPELYRAYGKSIGGGILMYGPPGCGKTHLARATAGEVRAFFLSVGIADVLEMWIGQSERNLRAIFDQARAHTPCVLFFDEVDALGARRSDMRQSAGRQTINQFLAELDGMEGDNEGVLVLAATNAPWHLDSAFRRPGRFDRIIFVPPPDETARAEILRVMLKDKPAGDVDRAKVAAKTKGFSGADLKGAVDLAVEAKLTEAIKRGAPQPLTTRDVLAAVKKVKPSTKEWFATARNYALYSNQGGFYDDILDYLKLKE
jgi:SpoVK/Ycf46/Vps4 family AAA+-type ATPase